MSEKVMIVSGRFQPLHNSHIDLWRELRSRYSEHLIICVLRRSKEVSLIQSGEYNIDEFLSLSVWAQAFERNPLPNWQRLRLVKLAVDAEPIFRLNTTVLLRDRPDLAWQRSIEDLPPNRVWIFNSARSELDRAKPHYYRSKGEEVIEVDFTGPTTYTGEVIRNRLRSGIMDLSFLPEACQEYFSKECLHFLVAAKKEQRDE